MDAADASGRTLRSAERKLRAFVSSVTEPLKDARREVGAAIAGLEMHPFVFEETPPSSEDLEDSYLRHVPTSEFFIWLADATTSEPTAREVRLAFDSPRPSLIIIEVDVESRDAETQTLLDEARSRVRTAPAGRDECAAVVRAALLDELNRAKQAEIDQKRALHQLPTPLSHFVDREAELEQIAQELSGPGRSVVMSGMGGVGKSALGLAASHAVKEGFPEAQLFLDLRDASGGPIDADQVTSTLLRLLGVPVGNVGHTSDDLAEQLRAILTQRRALVLLDNARTSAQVEPVLQAGGNGAVIITSREPLLDLQVGLRLPLTPFEHSDSVELLRSILGSDRVEREHEAAREIASLCEDLPLALRLAGARLAARPDWAITEYAEALRDETQRLDMLDASEQGLHASFNLSYADLTPTDAGLFVAATAFDGEFTAQPVAAMVDTEPAEATACLESLVDLGLLLATGMRRYRFHELVRLFAQDRLADHYSAEEHRAALARLARWYAAEATRYRAALRPGGDYV